MERATTTKFIEMQFSGTEFVVQSKMHSRTQACPRFKLMLKKQFV